MKPEKEWIVLIYLAADNDLSEEGVWALTEIAKIDWAIAQDMGVVVLFDSSGIGIETKIYEFGLPSTGEVSESKLKYAKFINSGVPFSDWVGNDYYDEEIEDASSPKLLKAFLQVAKSKYEATHYALILSGHGSGAIGDFLKSGQDVIMGADYKGMSIPNLGTAIRQAGIPIAILGMDSCLMSMAEIAYELPPGVQYLVGSEGFEPLTGWPYQEIFKALIEAKEPKNKNTDTKIVLDVTKIPNLIMDTYIAYYAEYNDTGTSVDMSICNLSDGYKENLRSAVEGLTTKLKTEMEDNQIVIDQLILAHWRAQSYKAEQYVDLWDFCDLLRTSLKDIRGLPSACESVQNAVVAMAHARYYGHIAQHSHGLSVYFPWQESEEIIDYMTLRFATESGWGSFLKMYIDKTRREKRGERRKHKGEYVDGATPIFTSFSGDEEGIVSVHKNNPPYSKNNPPYSKSNPLYTRNNPPYSKNNPPYSKNNPPYSKGLFATVCSMKNSPNGFLIDHEGKEILITAKDDE